MVYHRHAPRGFLGLRSEICAWMSIGLVIKDGMKFNNAGFSVELMHLTFFGQQSLCITLM